MATLRHAKRAASPVLDPLLAAMLGLAAGLSLGAQWQAVHVLLQLTVG